VGKAAIRERICANVARILQEKREKRGLSLNAFAAKAGLSRQTVAFIERGQRNPTLETLLRLSEVLETDLDEIIREARTE
jgi:transcriptional regulator with XRE-family HTH domain